MNPTTWLDDLTPDESADPSNLALFATLDDNDLQRWAVRSIAQPRSVPADSFTLHAPLELCARIALLRRATSGTRTSARQQIATLVAKYRSAAPPLDAVGHSSPVELPQLRHAIEAGDIDEVDRLAVTFCADRTPARVARELTDLVTPRLAAAGHAPILLRFLVTIAPSGAQEWSGLARGVLREIARHPDWTLSWWTRNSAQQADVSSTALFNCLLDVPSAGDPESNFIYPTMSLTERSGVAERVLGAAARATAPAAAQPQLLRIAAMSMLQDNADQAPYGWTHCLTLPQGTLGLAAWASDPSTSVAVASTFVLGFRATQSDRPLDPRWTPDPGLAVEPDTFLDAGPASAAATLWWADPSQLGQLTDVLIANALGHHDAHLVKYTLACLDAAIEDPPADRLYLAAAAFLNGWWRFQDAGAQGTLP